MDAGISVFGEECNFCIDPHERRLNLEMRMHCLDLQGNRHEINIKLHPRLVTKKCFFPEFFFWRKSTTL